MEVVVEIDNQGAKMTFLERMRMIRDIQDDMQGIPDIGNTMSAMTFAPSLDVETRRLSRPQSKTQHAQQRSGKAIETSTLTATSWTSMAIPSCGGSVPASAALNDVDYGEFKTDIRDQRRAGALTDLARKLAAQESQSRDRRRSRRPATNAAEPAGRRPHDRRRAARPNRRHGHQGRLHRPGAGGLQGAARDAQRPGLELRDRPGHDRQRDDAWSSGTSRPD